MRRALGWFGLSLLILILDVVSKMLVLGRFAHGERLEVTGFFNLVLVFNKGAAFSFLASAPGWQTPLFAGFAVLASLVISFLLLKNASKKMFCSGLALILGGAIGNLIDRLRYGHVVDFLDLHAFGWHWPAFNVADSAITVGAAILILEGFLPREKRTGASA
jgi:signal peptidase II